MRSWLPAGHLAWRMLEVTGGLDLAEFYAAYRADGQGQAPYDPRMMLTLVFCCYCKSRRSSRQIAAACADDVGCLVICGGPGPGYKTVAEFLRRHRDAVRRLFPQVLGMLAAGGAAGGHTAATDGPPVSGNASRFGNLTGQQLEARISELEESLAAAAAQWLDGAVTQPRPGDGADDGAGADDDDEDAGGGWPAGLPRRIWAMAAKLARLRAARDRLAARAADGEAAARAAAAADRADAAQARLEAAGAAAGARTVRYQAAVAAGKPWPYGKVPEPGETSKKAAEKRDAARKARDRARRAHEQAAALAAAALKVNPAGPGTRLLPAKNGGGWMQGWNLQLTAVRRQVLLAVELHGNPAGAGALIPSVQAAQAGLAAAAQYPGAAARAGQIRGWPAGSGYASAASFAALDDLLVLVAVTSEAAQAGRRGTSRAIPPGWARMAARLATPAGKALCKRRAAHAGPAFAQFFARFGRHFNYRGHDAADAEAKLMGMVHNISKLFARQDRTAPAPAPAPPDPTPAHGRPGTRPGRPFSTPAKLPRTRPGQGNPPRHTPARYPPRHQATSKPPETDTRPAASTVA